MNKGILSQEEIDALLNGPSNSTDNDGLTESPLNDDKELLSTVEIDALGEIGNISFGNSATALSTLLNQKVDITTPSVSIVRREELVEEFPKPYVAIAVDYTTGVLGSNVLVINQSDANIIADLMMGGDGLNPSQEFGEIQLSAVQEAMNQMMGSAATSLSTIFQKRVDISPPTIDLINLPEGTGADIVPDADLIVKVSFNLMVGNLINSSIMQIMPYSFAKKLVEELMGTQESSIQNNRSIAMEEVAATATEYYQEESTSSYDSLYETGDHQNQFMNQAASNKNPIHATASMESKVVQPAVFSDFSSVQPTVEEPRNLQMLLDIPLQVTVELGRTKKLVKEILELSSGSIVELDKLAGEPVDILVNNRLIARGEVVVIDENFGVRVTDIVSQSERINKMK